jgi:hypothetical protein
MIVFKPTPVSMGIPMGAWRGCGVSRFFDFVFRYAQWLVRIICLITGYRSRGAEGCRQVKGYKSEKPGGPGIPYTIANLSSLPTSDV